MFGGLTDKQKETLIPFIRNRVVTDLGAGSGEWSRYIISLGATRAVALDKEISRMRKHPQIEVIHGYFADFMDSVDVAFVAWPTNSRAIDGLVEILERASVVAYVGCNTGGTACGTPGFFQHLLQRELLAYEADRRNTLIVCGRRMDKAREPQGEEKAGIDSDTLYEYDEVEKCW